jgi:hypothetical protein
VLALQIGKPHGFRIPLPIGSIGRPISGIMHVIWEFAVPADVRVRRSSLVSRPGPAGDLWPASTPVAVWRVHEAAGDSVQAATARRTGERQMTQDQIEVDFVRGWRSPGVASMATP